MASEMFTVTVCTTILYVTIMNIINPYKKQHLLAQKAPGLKAGHYGPVSQLCIGWYWLKGESGPFYPHNCVNVCTRVGQYR